jgi:hypothetical protein
MSVKGYFGMSTKHALPRIIFFSFFPFSVHANSNHFTLQEMQDCVYYSWKLDEHRDSMNYFRDLANDALNEASLWANEGNSRLANHYYDNAKHYTSEQNFHVDESNKYARKMNDLCQSGTVSREIYNQACPEIERKNSFCRIFMP